MRLWTLLLWGMFFTGIFAMGLLTGGCATQVLERKIPTPPALIKANNRPGKLPSLIRLHDAKTHEFFCSGTVIAANYILTAGHCLADHDDGYLIEVQDAKGGVITRLATIAFTEERSDQGLVTGDFSAVNAAPVFYKPSAILSLAMDPSIKLISCGFPYGGEAFCTSFTNRQPVYFQIAGQGFVYPGMSGGPVFEADTGVIIGINTAMNGGAMIVSPLIELFAHAKVKLPTN